MRWLVQLAMAVGFALPCLLMGWRLWRVWRRPLSIENGRWVGLGVGIFVLELVLLHAGVMLGGMAAAAPDPRGKLEAVGWLFAFYGAFAGVVALAFRSPLLLGSFLWMIGGRCAAIALGISESDQALLAARSALGLTLYLPLVFASVLLPIPRFGITVEVAAAARPPNASGVWIDQPHRAIGVAAVYYWLLGAVELAVMSWIPVEWIVD